jgi:hypothetical protein
MMHIDSRFNETAADQKIMKRIAKEVQQIGRHDSPTQQENWDVTGHGPMLHFRSLCYILRAN